jgi:hypothetical protein
MQTCITDVLHQMDDFPVTNKELLAVTGSYCAGPNLDCRFKTRLEETSKQINQKEISSCSRNVKQKNPSICGNKIIISFHVC